MLYKWVFIFIAIAFISSESLGEEIKGRVKSRVKSFISRRRMSPLRRDGIVPDVIDSVPKDTITVKYPSGVEVNYGNELTPTQVKDKPTVVWPADGNSLYALVMTDPDAPSRKEPVNGQVKHWLVVNIPGADVAKGRPLADYIGSGPPQDTGLHRYVFLVYKQTATIDTNEKNVSNRSREGRLKWKVRDFAKQYNLGEPIAANFYQAQYDDWVPIFRQQFTE